MQNLDPILVGDSIAWFPKGDQRTENDLPLSVLEKCMVEISAFDEHFVVSFFLLFTFDLIEYI